VGFIAKYKEWRKRQATKLLGLEGVDLEKLRYAAAKPSRLDKPNGPGLNWDVNALIETANPILRERIRGMVRNFPPFVRAINAHSAFVVGKGARFQSMVTTKDGQIDGRRRRFIEDKFRRWMDKASVDGQSHFYDLQRMAIKQKLETGEFFCSFRKPKKRNRHPLALQFIEPDRILGGIDVKPNRGSSVVWQGIEFDPNTGEIYGYYVQNKDWPQKYEYEIRFIPQEQMIHGYEPYRPDQLRGVSQFAPAIILAETMGDYIGAELDAAKMNSMWVAFVQSPDPRSFQAGFNQQFDTMFKGSPETRRDDIESWQSGQVGYLRPGETMTLAASPQRVTDSFDRFTRFVLRMVASVIGLPYEVLSGDYQGINYSTARMSRQDYNLILEPERFWIERKFNRPVFNEWLKYQYLMDPSSLPGYLMDPSHYEKALWVPAGMPSPDPLKEGKADMDDVNAGFRSPQQVILSHGDDPEQVLEEIATWQKQVEEKGVKLNTGMVSTATQTNPAALEEQDGY
jgi:lambda family phage portal protein